MKNKDIKIVPKESGAIVLVWECKGCRTKHRCSPYWHQNNGTPNCEKCDTDMTFKHTEINLKELKELK